jgi:DNA-binding protein HU-beta
MKLYKKQLLEKVIQRMGKQCDKKIVQSVVKEFIDVMGESLQNGDSVTLVNFGTFNTAPRKERVINNLITGKPVKIDGRTVPVFKAAKALKELVKN